MKPLADAAGAPEPGGLAPGQMQVWLADPAACEPAQLAARHAHLLSPAERMRHQAFRFARDRHTYLAAHALARRVLAGVTGIAPEALTFVSSPTGKPAPVLPASVPALGYNLSHTDGLVACAVGGAMACGVDVEVRRPLDDLLNLAASIFAPAEVAQLRACQGDARETLFFTLWTVREAYAKATGDGIAADLSHIAFEIDGERVRARFDAARDGAGWHFHTLPAGPRHLLAVAARTAAPLRVAVHGFAL